MPSFDADPGSRRVCDYATYMRLLAENAELQRSNNVLKSLAKTDSPAGKGKHKLDSGEDKSRLETLETELKILLATNKDLEALLEGRSVDATLVEEKSQLHQLNAGLAEKIATLRETEAALVARMTDAKEQAELLEFRVLELEEERDKLKADVGNKVEAVTDDVDSGCNTSTATDGTADLLELYQDFRKEKVADTKSRLQALVSSTPEANNKSLLLQTVALFETLLAKIHNLQDENEQMKLRLEVESKYDMVVLELEGAREALVKSKEV